MTLKLEIIGIDPGSRSGAIAMFVRNAGGLLSVLSADLPTIKEGKSEQVSAAAFARCLKECDLRGATAWLENVHSMPKQGVASSFKFGESVGIVKGVLAALGVPLRLVTPATWQKATMGSTAGKDRERIRAEAQQQFPDIDLKRKKDHNRAAALLIAKYGSLQNG